MDSEDWAHYRQVMAESRKTEKTEHLKENTSILEGRAYLHKDVQFTVHNEGLHYIVEYGGRKYDLWPSTGRWHDRTTGKRSGGGTPRLFKHMGIE